MNVLLDTCPLCWIANDSEELSAAAREALEGARSVFVSRVFALELGLKVRKGKLELPETLERRDSRVLEQHALEELPHGGEVAILSTVLPPLRQDPADRLLIAVAQVHDFVLLTPDEKSRCDPGVNLLW